MKFPRLYVSSWIVFCGVMLLGIVVNCGGDYSDEDVSLDFGWPWRYGSIQSNIRERVFLASGSGDSLAWGDKWIWWRCNHAETLSRAALAFDAAIVLLLTAGTAGAWEWRRRRRTRWLQFTLADIMAATAAVAVLFGLGQRAYHDNMVERQLDSLLLSLPDMYQIGSVSFGRPYSGTETPGDWFWETLKVPGRYRPYCRISMSIDGVRHPVPRWPAPPQVLPAAATESIAELRSLRRLWLAEVQLSADDCRQLATLPRLQFVSLTDGELDAAKLAALATSPSLLHVDLRNIRVSDEDLAVLAQCPTLVALDLYSPIQDDAGFRGHRLSAFRSLEHLVVEGVALDDQAVDEIARLPVLKTLNCEELFLSDEGRKRLARLFPPRK